MKKRIFAIVLCLVMALTSVNFAFAAESVVEGTPTTSAAEEDSAVGSTMWIKSGIKIYKNYNNTDKNFYLTSFPHKIRIVEAITDENDAKWYKFDFADGTNFIIGMSAYKYVKVEDVTVKKPDEGSTDTEDSVVESEDGNLEISGKFPAGARVEVTTPENEVMEEVAAAIDPDMENYFSIMEFHDISLSVDGERKQPGDLVQITLKTALPTDEKVRVFHILDDAEAIKEAIADKKAKSFVAKDLERLADAIEAAEAFSDVENTVYYTTLSSEDGEVTINEDGTISFETDSFSIYAVNAYNDETGTLLTPNSTITMKRDEVRYFKWDGTGITNLKSDERGTWTVESGDDYVDFEVYNSFLENGGGDNTSFYRYYWLKLTAVEPSGNDKAQIQFEYVTGDGSTAKPYKRVQEYFYVQVEETDAALYVDDQIVENGCLVPVFTNPSVNTEDVVYEWTRSDGVTVKEEALKEPYITEAGAVNVAMDRGGIDAADIGTKANPKKTYTVKAKRGDTIIGEAKYTVAYGNELLNGSFEYPVSVYATHDYPNGAPNLYWKTTSESVREHEVCQDIEILNKDEDIERNGTVFKNTYGILKLKNPSSYDPNKKYSYDTDVEADYDLPDGNQVAEINCDAPGALYQDILTYPGTEMNWELSHRGRNYSGSSGANGGAWLPDGKEYQVTHKDTGKVTTLKDQKDYMYVIAAPTDQVEHIKTQTQLNKLIAAAGYLVDDFTVQKPTTEYSFDGAGKEVEYEGIKYKIWEVATDHTAWKQYGSSVAYTVNEGEYLTRFFFAAGSTSQDRVFVALGDSANYSAGNFIDKVSFSDEMSWRIEYYVDGNLVPELTESGTVDLPRDTMQYELNKVASNMGASQLQQYTYVRSEINGRPFIGTTLDKVYTQHNVLQLYYETYGATVNKQIEIEDYDEFTDEEKQQVKDALANYTVPFKLYKGDDVVAEASVAVDPETLVGTATFMSAGTNVKFEPKPNDSYVIKEGDLPEIDGLVLKSKAADSEALTGVRVYTHTATNKYKVRTELTIEKDVNGLRNDENQSFLFRVQGKDGTLTEGIDLTVRTTGDDSITVTELPIGEYIVTEIGDWSWRYSLDEVTDTDKTVKNLNKETGSATVTVDLDGNTIKFKNTRPLIYWLSGDSHVENRWSGENGNVVKNPVNKNN